MWSYGGLKDETILAFPMLLLFTAILGSFRLVTVLFIGISIIVFANGYVNETGIYVNDPGSINIRSSVLTNVILLVIYICTFMAAHSINTLVSKLVKENAKVNKSAIRIKKLVHQDALTGLPNRVGAKKQFENSLLKSTQINNQVAMLFIDLDDFKSIN